MASKADFDKRANDAWTALQNGLKAIDADRNLTPEGKAQQAGRLWATYQAAIAQIQDEARGWGKSARRTAQLGLQIEQKRVLLDLRTEVGDTLCADIIRRQLERMDSAAIQSTFEAVKDDKWLRGVVRSYGTLIIEDRAEPRSAEDTAALAAMKGQRYSSDVEHEQVLLDLEPKRFENWAADLDRGARAQSYADKYRVSAAHVPLPVPGDPLN